MYVFSVYRPKITIQKQNCLSFNLNDRIYKSNNETAGKAALPLPLMKLLN